MATAEAPFPHRHELAEMPYWDAARRRLCYVDIDRGTINELDTATGDLHVIELTGPLGFAMPVAGSDVRLCGQGNDLIAVDASGHELGRMPRHVNPRRRCIDSTSTACRASGQSRSATAPTGTLSAGGCITSTRRPSGSTWSTTT